MSKNIICINNIHKLPCAKLAHYLQLQFHVKNAWVFSSKRFSTTPTAYHSAGLISDSDSGRKYKAVFLGSDNFSLPSLVALERLLGPDNVTVVVSNDKNRIGKYSAQNGIRMVHWNDFKSKEFIDEGTRLYDFGVVASFGYLIPASVIQRFPLGILNVHASLLPRWRGASPIAYSLINGDATTGISIMKIAPHRFDIGPVLHQAEVGIDPHVRAPELTIILADMGASGLSTVISDLKTYLKNPIAQDESKATLSPKLSAEMAEINWSAMTSIQIYNLFRGLSGTFKLNTGFSARKVDLDEICLVSRKPIETDVNSNANDNVAKSKLTVATEFKNYYPHPVVVHCEGLPEQESPGKIHYVKDNLFVKSLDESVELAPWICVRKVKIGQKWMSAKDFQNGFLSKVPLDQQYFAVGQQSKINSSSNVDNNLKPEKYEIKTD